MYWIFLIYDIVLLLHRGEKHSTANAGRTHPCVWGGIYRTRSPCFSECRLGYASDTLFVLLLWTSSISGCRKCKNDLVSLTWYTAKNHDEMFARWVRYAQSTSQLEWITHNCRSIQVEILILPGTPGAPYIRHWTCVDTSTVRQFNWSTTARYRLARLSRTFSLCIKLTKPSHFIYIYIWHLEIPLVEQTITGISSSRLGVVIPKNSRPIFAFECLLSYVEAQICRMSHKKDSIHTV